MTLHHRFHHPTLADVIERLETADLSPVRRRDLVSAVKRAARLLGCAPHQVSADPAALRQSLAAVETSDLSPKSLQNVRSDLSAALESSEVAQVLRAAREPVDLAWRDLLASCDQYRWTALSRLSAYCSERGVTPHEVGQPIFDAFAAALEASLVRHPHQVRRAAARAWNIVAAERGLAPVVVDERPAKLKVDWGSLPRSFVDDVEDYLGWLGGQDPFAENARSRALKPSTIRLRRDELESAVAALVASRRAPATICSLADLCDLESFKAIMRQRLGASREAGAYDFGLATALIQLAKEWVRVPPAQLDELKRLRAKLDRPLTGLTDKNKATLRRFDDPQLLTRLVALPARLFPKDAASRQRALADAQAALAIAILLDLPLRMANLAGLRFGKTLFVPDNPRAPVNIDVPGSLTKTGQPITAGLSDDTSRLIRRYLKLLQDLLPSAPDWLFCNGDGSPKGQGTVAGLFGRAVHRALGIDITPHQVRHLAAKILLDTDPGNYELVRQLLGHASQKTTVQFYAGIDTRRAAKAHQALLQELIDNPPPKPGKPRGRR
jgi:integrase